MSKYRVLQLTNDAVAATVVDSFLPLGVITRRIQDNDGCCATFHVTTSNADTVYLNEVGNYDITYSASLIAGAVGEVSATLIANGTAVYEVGATIAAVGDVVNITLPYQVRVCPNCASSPNNCPMSIQIKLTGVEVTGGKSNLLIERVY